mgnify:CR=1 FL=1
MMTEDRQLVAIAVLNGELGAEYLSHEEVAEIQERVMDLVFEHTLITAQERGKAVFSGIEGGFLN